VDPVAFGHHETNGARLSEKIHTRVRARIRTHTHTNMHTYTYKHTHTHIRETYPLQ